MNTFHPYLGRDVTELSTDVLEYYRGKLADPRDVYPAPVVGPEDVIELVAIIDAELSWRWSVADAIFDAREAQLVAVAA